MLHAVPGFRNGKRIQRSYSEELHPEGFMADMDHAVLLDYPEDEPACDSQSYGQ